MSAEETSKKNRDQPCDFIGKLAKIIENEPEIISFSEDGNEVIIHDEPRFTNKLLEMYFRHDQWRSFVRQMNMYGFKKINRGLKTYIFVNPIFRRGNQQNYHLIRRKVRNREEVFHEQEHVKDEVFDQLRYLYGESSMVQFLEKVNQLKAEVESTLVGVKKDIEDIAKKRKTTLDIKPVTNGIKEIIQIVEESDRKFMSAMERYKEYQENQYSNSRNMNFPSISSSGQEGHKYKSTNPLIPQPMIPASQQVLRESANIAQSRPATLPGMSGIQITSQSSFSFLMNYLQE